MLVFTCNHCPVAQAYEDRLVALQRDYRDKGVRLVAVNVNNLDADKLGPMKVRAKEKQFNFPYLYDPTQKMGRDYGATKTPEIFVLDGERKTPTTARLTTARTDKVKTQHLRQALDAILAGAPPKAEVLAFGRTIKYDN